MMSVRRLVLGAGACVALASCSTGGVSDLEPTSATLHGTVQTAAEGGSWFFQYAKRAEDLGTLQGASTPTRALAPNTPSTEVTEPITGLTADSRYAYRLCGSVPGGSIGCLATRRFATPPVGSRSITFDEPGIHHFTVPEDAGTVSALIVGAGGGAGYNPFENFAIDPYLILQGPGFPSDGGKGGSIQGDLFFADPGTELEIHVGSKGGDAMTVGAIFPGAGGAGGSNGVTRGGNGGSGNHQDGPLDLLRNGGSGGGGGGAASEVLQVIGSSVFSAAAGGGGGGGGGTETNLDARGGDGGAVPTSGTDGARFDPKAPRSLGGNPRGKGGLGGGQDADAGNGGDGGSDTTRVPVASECGPWDKRQGGGGGGGGGSAPLFVGGGGGGGSGRLYVASGRLPCPLAGLFFEYDAASGGGGAGNDALAMLAPIGNTGVQAGDGFVTLTWAVGDGGS